MIIGLTGGSGTGKSTVSKAFENAGYAVIDLDKTYSRVITPPSECLCEISKVFGEKYILQDGTLDRKEMGKLVFSNSEKLDILNKITHKYIIEEMHREIDMAGGKDIVLDAPILFKAGIDKMCDCVVCVVADKNMRVERIVARDGISEEKAVARINAQMTNEEYIEKSDFIIENNGDIDTLNSDTLKLIERLKG